MWRVIQNRLGVGYLLLLPALFAIGAAADAAVHAFCYHLHFALEAVTGRGISETGGMLKGLAWRH